MDLPEYLTTGFPNQAAAAATFKVSQGTISHWRNRRRFPKVGKAKEIIKHAKRRGCHLSFDSIYKGGEFQ